VIACWSNEGIFLDRPGRQILGAGKREGRIVSIHRVWWRGAVVALFAALAFAASASAARPVLAVVGQPVEHQTGATGEPYAQTGVPVQLSVTYHHSLSRGSTLQLRSQAKYMAAFLPSRVRIILHGGRATLHVIVTEAQEKAAGSLIRSYEIAVVSHGRVLSSSRPVEVLFAPPPPAVQVLEGSGADESVTTNTSTGAVTCSFGTPHGNACADDTVYPGEVFYEPEVAASDLPPKWEVKLLFNGQTVCTDDTLQGSCSRMITVPSNAPVGQANPLIGELISPQGKTTQAILDLTNTGNN
jgi:hypothetical protein